MLKRTLLVVGMMAALFSVQADLMVYSFEGVYTKEVVNTVDERNVNISFNYDILIDFDESGLISGEPQDDDYTFGSMHYDYNYGSVDFSPEDLYYTNTAVEYTTAYALERTEILSPDIILDRLNVIEFLGEDNIHTGFCNRLIFLNNTSFGVGSLFSVTEEHEDYDNDLSYTLSGSAHLMSIMDYEPPQSVPEPGSMTLIASSLIALTTIRFQRKKHPKK